MTRNRPSEKVIRTAYQLVSQHRPLDGGRCTCGRSRTDPECRGARAYAKATLILAGLAVTEPRTTSPVTRRNPGHETVTDG